MLFPTDGSSPVEAKGIGDQDTPLNFTMDGKAIFVAGPPVESMIQVMRVDLANGARTLWKEIRRTQGMQELAGEMAMTQDGRSYVYAYGEGSSELYLAEGLK